MFAIIVLRLVFATAPPGANKLVLGAGNVGEFAPHDWGRPKRLLMIALLGGLVITLYEPRMLLGSFQKTASWWAAAGILLAMRAR